MAMVSNRPVRTTLRELPATAFGRRVDGLASMFGVIGFMATPLVCVLLTFEFSREYKPELRHCQRRAADAAKDAADAGPGPFQGERGINYPLAI